MLLSSDKKGFVYTLDVFIAVGIIVAGSWILMFNLFSQSDTIRPRIVSEDLIAESYGKRIIELNYPLIQNFSRNGTITDNTKTFSEQIGEFYWLSIKREDDVYIKYAREMIDEYYRGIIPSQYQFMVRIGDFNDPILRTDAVYFRTERVSTGGVGGISPNGHSCAIREDGILVCWGHNNEGQLGTGDTSNTYEATPVDTNLRFRMVSAGEIHTCAIDLNNDLYCWGNNDNGRLGISSGQISPITSSGSDFLYVSAGSEHTCGIKNDRSLWCWGSQSDGRLGNGITSGFINIPEHIDSANVYQIVSAGVTHTCAIRVGGDAYCWGSNNRGQLGNGGGSSSSTPVRAGTIRFLSVDAGDEFSCGIEAAFDRKIYCWGESKHPGANTNSPSQLPVQSSSVQNRDFSQISLGSDHGCGIGIDSNAYCWGSNTFGRLGIGSIGGSARALIQTDKDGPYSSISAGLGHTCAIRQDNNTMLCWGFNVRGQTGQSPGGPQTNPLEIVPTDYTYLSNELRILHSRNTTPMNNSQLILPSRTIVGGIDRDDQFYGPFVFEVVVWL